MTHTSVGSQEDCLACIGYRKLHGVIRPYKHFYYVLPKYGRYNVLRVVTALACDHRYGLIFSLIVFLRLKVDYARIAQWEKN